MNVPAVIGHILAEINERKTRAEQVFVRFAEDARLPEMLGKKTSWAIVGGAVRDCLLSHGEQYLQALFVPWPDVDVAVAARAFSLSERLAELEDVHYRLSVNSFGGWKASLSPGGELDVWRLPASIRGHLSVQRWHDYLGSVDFSLNAVAFIWPQRRIVMHPRWISDLRSRHIEKLSGDSPRPELQPVRAIALGAKLHMLTGCKFKLGRLVCRDLVWLLTESEEEQRQKALDYFKHKAKSGRWSRHALAIFFSKANAADDHPALLQPFAHLIGVAIEGRQRPSRAHREQVSRIGKLWEM